MSAVAKKRASTHKTVMLTTHDINVLSAIARQPKLPAKYIITYAKKSNISKDAHLVLEELIKRPDTRSSKKKPSKPNSRDDVAHVFYRWAHAVKESA